MSIGFLSNDYVEWRASTGVVLALREDPLRPPERLLQMVWLHQRVLRDKLKTADGQSVRVLHPGFWNREAGPDFRGALVQFEDESPKTGDVEVDLCSSGWQAHRHDRNPAFKQVMLHVVWEGDSRSSLPTLVLKPLLDASLSELGQWLGSDSVQVFPEELRGKCSDAWGKLSKERREEILCQAALVRLQSKAAQYQARARQAGWEQALWEGLFRALGYKHNVWPMQRLAELQPVVTPLKDRSNPVVLQARLFGIGGLLPDEIIRAEAGTDQYVRRLWDFWWRERESFAVNILPRGLWRFHGLRPANHPQRRLALAAHWLAKGNLIERLEKWCTEPVKDAQLSIRLLTLLQTPEDDYWSWHWTLRSKRLAKAQPLLGGTRVNELAMNAILPWLWVRAAEGKNEVLQREIERRYLSWPAAEDNSVLRLARQRLLNGAERKEFSRAAMQQGLLQIVRDFCDNTNPICQDCRLPELLGNSAARTVRMNV